MFALAVAMIAPVNATLSSEVAKLVVKNRIRRNASVPSSSITTRIATTTAVV
jgi:hypothetical protein